MLFSRENSSTVFCHAKLECITRFKHNHQRNKPFSFQSSLALIFLVITTTEFFFPLISNAKELEKLKCMFRPETFIMSLFRQMILKGITSIFDKEKRSWTLQHISPISHNVQNLEFSSSIYQPLGCRK